MEARAGGLDAPTHAAISAPAVMGQRLFTGREYHSPG